jgi:hypothetical protein
MNCCYKSKFKEKVKIFDHGRQLLKEKLNITNLIKAYLDIEKLKYVLMSADQLVLFELIQNPKIDLDLLNEKSKKIDTLAEYMLNRKNIASYNKDEVHKIFEKVIANEDLLSKKILLAHSESLF